MKKLVIFNKKNTSFEKCPECGQITLHRSRSRNIIEKLLKKTRIVNLFRCSSCGWRGYKFKFYIGKNSFVTLFFYIVLTIVVAFMIKYLIVYFVN